MAQPAPLTTNPIARMRNEVRTERSLSAPLPDGPKSVSIRRGTRFLEEPLTLLLESYREYGPVFTLRLLTTPTVWMIGPEANHFLLVSGTKHVRWRDGLMGDMIPLVGDGLLTTDEDVHDRARRLVQPAFSRKAVEQQVAVMIEEADAAIGALRIDEPLDVYLWARRLALGIAMRGLFGITADADRREEVAERFEDALSFYFRQIWWQLLRGPATPFQRMVKQRQALSALVLQEIASRRSRNGDGSPADDVLSRLVLAEDNGDRLTDGEICDQVLTLLFAGHDTTTSTISFMLHELARHPNELALLVSEIDDVLGGEPPTPAQLFDGLPRLEAVLAETLRMYPAAWWGPRRVHSAFEFEGHRIPAGALVHYSSWVTQRLPHLYPDPEAFVPERFTSGAVAKLPKGSYIPFGGGTRICVGKRFGELEIKTIAIRLLQRLRPELEAGFSLTTRQAPTLSPRDGMPMTMRVRA
jgi:cytochrome P450